MKSEMIETQKKLVIEKNSHIVDRMDKVVEQEVVKESRIEEVLRNIKLTEGRINIASRSKKPKEAQRLQEELEEINQENLILISEKEDFEFQRMFCENQIKQKIITIADRLDRGSLRKTVYSKIPTQVKLGDKIISNPFDSLRCKHLNKGIEITEQEQKLLDEMQAKINAQKEKRFNECQKLNNLMLTQN